jgi:hypothetical protein
LLGAKLIGQASVSTVVFKTKSEPSLEGIAYTSLYKVVFQNVLKEELKPLFLDYFRF